MTLLSRGSADWIPAAASTRSQLTRTLRKEWKPSSPVPTTVQEFTTVAIDELSPSRSDESLTWIRKGTNNQRDQ